MQARPPKSGFTRFAKWMSHMTGRPVSFVLAEQARGELRKGLRDTSVPDIGVE